MRQSRHVDTPRGGGGVDGYHDVGGDRRRRRAGPSSAPTCAYSAASAGVRMMPWLTGVCVQWQASLAEEVAEVKLEMPAPIQTPRRVTHVCSHRCLPRGCTRVAARCMRGSLEGIVEDASTNASVCQRADGRLLVLCANVRYTQSRVAAAQSTCRPCVDARASPSAHSRCQCRPEPRTHVCH